MAFNKNLHVVFHIITYIAIPEKVNLSQRQVLHLAGIFKCIWPQIVPNLASHDVISRHIWNISYINLSLLSTTPRHDDNFFYHCSFEYNFIIFGM